MTPMKNPACVLNDRHQFNESGFRIAPTVLAASQCDALCSELTELLQQRAATRRTRGGLRNVLQRSTQALGVATSQEVLSLVSSLAGQTVFPVRGILFDKNADANWSVPWHQDLVIAVAERMDAPGFGPWSVKDEVVHVQPPTRILADMITVRLHLDECVAENGAVRVVPSSHRSGELNAEQIEAFVGRNKPVVCEVPRGGALIMRPLLLHASSPAKAPSHRRVLHIEYASTELPNGLKWFEQS
jgi:ectoine hydroxylase-related dioxygenase (phytanoyl-CoA dioxygenase family)